MILSNKNNHLDRAHALRLVIDPNLLENEMHRTGDDTREIRLVGSRTGSGTLVISEPIQEERKTNNPALSTVDRALKKAFFEEFRRRRICQITFTYTVVAWGILQLSSIVCPTLGMPEWTMKATIGLLMAGLAIVIFVGSILERSQPKPLGAPDLLSRPKRSDAQLGI
jgi:hypothetical protein